MLKEAYIQEPRNAKGGMRKETYRVLLRGRDLLDGERVVEQAVAREVLLHVLLHELDTEIRVVDALDLVADTRDCKCRQIQCSNVSRRVATH